MRHDAPADAASRQASQGAAGICGNSAARRCAAEGSYPRHARREGAAGRVAFHGRTDSIWLGLTPADASSWAKKIGTPPPSLRRKLGLDEGMKAFVMGPPGSTELAEALHGATADAATTAAIFVAIVTDEQDLRAALIVHAGLRTAHARLDRSR